MKTQKKVIEILLGFKRMLRMRKTSFAIPLLCVVLISSGCKKNQDAISKEADYRQTVADWYRSFATNASEKDKQSAEAFIKILDYSQSTQIERDNGPTLVLVKITGEQNAFFGISRLGNALTFDGIYLSKELAYIQQVITTKTLPANNSVLVYSLDKRPVRGWESNSSGKMLQHLATERSGSSPVKKVSTQSVRMNNAGWEECSLVYWVTWNIQTGKLLSATFLYNTCDNVPVMTFIDPGPGPGMTGGGDAALGTNEIDEYNEQLRLFNEEVEGATAADHQEDGSFSISDYPGDLLTKNWSADWICLQGSTWNLRSYEVGKLRACNLPGHPWAFKSMSHQGIAFEGSPPPNTDISFTQGFGYPSFTEENAAILDYLAALMQLKFSVTYRFIPIGSGLIQTVTGFVNPPKTKPYEARGAWKLS